MKYSFLNSAAIKICALILCLALAATSNGCGNEVKAGLKEVGGGLLQDILHDVTSGQNLTYLLSLKGTQAKLDFVAQVASVRVKGLAKELYDAAQTGDNEKLRTWAANNLPSVLPLLDKYSATQILRQIDRISPDIAATLRASVPQALDYLFINGRIQQPTLEAVALAYRTKSLRVSDDETKQFADLLAAEWKKIQDEKRARATAEAGI